MPIIPRYLLAALTAALLAPAHARADDRAPTREELASIQEATRNLTREVEYLQDVVEEQGDEKERGLYRQADVVLAGVEAFRKSLKPATTRERLYKEFDERDPKLHELLKSVQGLGPEQRLLKRAAAKVRAADDQLHYALFVGDTSEARTKQVLERQTHSFLDAAQQLDKTGAYSLGAVQGRGVLVGDLHKLAEEAEQFQKGLAAGNDRAIAQGLCRGEPGLGAGDSGYAEFESGRSHAPAPRRRPVRPRTRATLPPAGHRGRAPAVRHSHLTADDGRHVDGSTTFPCAISTIRRRNGANAQVDFAGHRLPPV